MDKPDDLTLAPPDLDKKAAFSEVRCRCHRLVMIVRGDTLEMKCPRCQRYLLVETSGIKRISVRGNAVPLWRGANLDADPHPPLGPKRD